ncbi:hypothetical protein [Primorskyibacter sedentarius]|uniref:hypothetical protein n=1 Tax=Primorskyibacter sedentarius TaxID=745311 RepID=UPI0014046BC6|nr:hypothetical protein [Primorskyibacter sedentarius]
MSSIVDWKGQIAASATNWTNQSGWKNIYKLLVIDLHSGRQAPCGPVCLDILGGPK